MPEDTTQSVATQALQVKNVKFTTDAVAGTLTDSAAGDVLCDFRLAIDVDGTTYYIPLFNTAP